MTGMNHYLLYGSCIIIPCLLLVVIGAIMRCKFWVRCAARELEGVRLDIKLAAASRTSDSEYKLTEYELDRLKTYLRDEVETSVRNEINFYLAASPESALVIDEPSMPCEAINTALMSDDNPISATSSYCNLYLKKADVTLNDIGVKRVAVNPDYWHKLNLLTFVNEEPISISAIMHNILTEHFATNNTEIEELAEKGRINMKHGHGRY